MPDTISAFLKKQSVKEINYDSTLMENLPAGKTFPAPGFKPGTSKTENSLHSPPRRLSIPLLIQIPKILVWKWPDLSRAFVSK